MIKFCFQGFVVGAKIETVTVTETGKPLDVHLLDDAVIAEKLNSGEWCISLADYLYCSRKNEIEMVEFEVDQ